MSDTCEFGWAAFYANGNLRPFISIHSVRARRADVYEYIGKGWTFSGETPRQGWRRAYRNGWRCVRVSVDIAFAAQQRGEKP